MMMLGLVVLVDGRIFLSLSRDLNRGRRRRMTLLETRMKYGC
jgi:hypothetical protein